MKSISFKNIWAHALIAWFVLFISAILVFVMFAIQHPMSLVSEDYYEQELAYQQRIDNSARAKALPGIAVTYHSEADTIRIALPVNPTSDKITGHIRLYRPSTAKLDQTFTLALAPDGTQQLNTSTIKPGLWKVQLHWKQDEKEFFHEQAIVTQ